jgi:carboxyvinyl-carboxyphosphonate phosphorylmutase
VDVTKRRERFRAILAGDRCVRGPYVFDPISARIAEDLGFEVGLVGAGVTSRTLLSRPDVTVLTLTEFADQVRRICRASDISLMVIGDNGFGNALNVMRTVEELEAAGAAAVSIDDSLLPQRFGKAASVELISLEEGVSKMKAALAARKDPNLVIIGHIRALAIEGVDEAIRRGKAYKRAGVDALFIGGIPARPMGTARTKPEQVAAVHAAIDIPLVVGSFMMETEPEFLAANGVRIAHEGAMPFLAAVKAVHDLLKALWDGVSPTALQPHLASLELLDQITRQADYNQWIAEYLNSRVEYTTAPEV